MRACILVVIVGCKRTIISLEFSSQQRLVSKSTFEWRKSAVAVLCSAYAYVGHLPKNVTNAGYNAHTRSKNLEFAYFRQRATAHKEAGIERYWTIYCHWTGDRSARLLDAELWRPRRSSEANLCFAEYRGTTDYVDGLNLKMKLSGLASLVLPFDQLMYR